MSFAAKVKDVDVSEVKRWVIENWQQCEDACRENGCDLFGCDLEKINESYTCGPHVGSEVLGGAVGTIKYKRLEIVVDDKCNHAESRKEKKRPASKKPQTNTPQRGKGKEPIITAEMVLSMDDESEVAIPESRGSRNAHIKSMGDKHVVSNPGNWDRKQREAAIMLKPIAKGTSRIVWYIGKQKYITPVTVG